MVGTPYRQCSKLAEVYKVIFCPVGTMQHAMRCDGWGKGRPVVCAAAKPAGLHQCIHSFQQCQLLVPFPAISRLFFCSSRGWSTGQLHRLPPGSDSDSRIASMQPTPPSTSNPPNPPWPSDVARRCKALPGVAARCRFRSLRPRPIPTPVRCLLCPVPGSGDGLPCLDRG